MPTVQRDIRYLTTEELVRLRRHSVDRALLAREKGTVGAVRDWALLDTLLSSWLRPSEAAVLQVGDCHQGYGQASVVVRQCKGSKARKVFHPPGTESPPEGVPGVEAGPRGGCLGRSACVHWAAGTTDPKRRLAGGQGAHAGLGSGSPVRHAHVSAHVCDSSLPGKRRRPRNRPGAAWSRQHQDHDDLRQGHQGGQAAGDHRPWEDLRQLATEPQNWCELEPTTTWKSRSFAWNCCESLTHFPSTTEFLAIAWPTGQPPSPRGDLATHGSNCPPGGRVRVRLPPPDRQLSKSPLAAKRYKLANISSPSPRRRPA